MARCGRVICLSRETNLTGCNMLTINLNKHGNDYRPGEIIAGEIVWSDLQGDRLDVRLIWYTQGKGDRDVEIVDHSDLTNPAEKGSHPFQFVAPHRPHSFSSKLISLTWAVEAIVFPSKNAEQTELVISPTGRETVLTPIQNRADRKQPFVQLGRRK